MNVCLYNVYKTGVFISYNELAYIISIIKYRIEGIII